MLDTRTEAAAKLCCVAGAGHRDGRCAGPVCMAWRWAEPVPQPGFRPIGDRERVAEPVRPEGLPASFTWSPAYVDDEDGPQRAGWRESTVAAEARRRGFCGRAGDPTRPHTPDC